MAIFGRFNNEEALDRTLLLFWERGYEGTALSGLLAEMRMTKSSIYQAFGSKEALFRRVRERYDERYLGFRREALEKTTPRQIVVHLLNGMLGLHTGSATPPGCLVTNAALACSPASESSRLQVAREREAFRQVLCDRLTEASAAGPLPKGLDTGAAKAWRFRPVRRKPRRTSACRSNFPCLLAGNLTRDAPTTYSQNLRVDIRGRRGILQTPFREQAVGMQSDHIKPKMEVIGADGVHVGTVDRVQGDRIKLVKSDSGASQHEGHHHFVRLGLVADVEGNKVRLSANASIAITLEEEGSGKPV
jgi:AcrR family transcriptional regulator